MATPADDRQLLSELLASGSERRLPAPTDSTLADYLTGRLAEPEADRVRAWVAADAAHAARLLDLEPFVTAAPPPAGVVDFEARAAWGAFERRRREEEGRRPLASALRGWMAAAAVLALATGGLGLRVWQLEQARQRPVANLRTLELIGETRAAGAPIRFEIVPGEPFRLAVYPAPLGAGCSAYDGALETAAGGRVASLSGLAPDPRGRLDLLLPGQPGDLQLVLEACGEPRGRFAFELVSP